MYVGSKREVKKFLREKSIIEHQTTHDTQLGKLQEYTTGKDCFKNILRFRLFPRASYTGHR